MTKKELDAIISIICEIGILLDDAFLNVVDNLGASTLDAFNRGYIPMETLTMKSGKTFEIIDGYDVVPLSDSEYSDMPFNTAWGMKSK